MTGFFEAFRRMFAAESAAKALGQVAMNVINDVFLPKLRRDLAKARTDRERELLSELVSQYERYGDENAPESRLFGEIADRVVAGEVSAYRLGRDQEDDLVQMVAVDFYQPLREGGKDLTDDLVRHEVRRGPVDFSKYWARMLKFRVHWRLREMVRRNPDMFQKKEEREDEEGGRTTSPFDKLRSEGPTPAEEAARAEELTDEAYLSRIKGQMYDYMWRRTKKDPVLHDMFKLWKKVADAKGADYLFGQRKVKEELFEPLQRLYDVSKSGLDERLQELRRMFKAFFEEVLKMRLTDAQLRAMHLASWELVAYGEYARRAAAWVLGVLVPR